MTVEELIEILKTKDQVAKVTVFGYNHHGKAEDMKEV